MLTGYWAGNGEVYEGAVSNQNKAVTIDYDYLQSVKQRHRHSPTLATSLTYLSVESSSWFRQYNSRSVIRAVDIS
jgi:hypothetical protein